MGLSVSWHLLRRAACTCMVDVLSCVFTRGRNQLQKKNPRVCSLQICFTLPCQACAAGQFAQARAGEAWCCLQRPVPCSAVLCVTPWHKQDASGCNHSSVWLKCLGRDSRGRKSSPGRSVLSQCVCHKASRMVNDHAGGTAVVGCVRGSQLCVLPPASEKPYTELKPCSPKCALCCLCA